MNELEETKARVRRAWIWICCMTLWLRADLTRRRNQAVLKLLGKFPRPEHQGPIRILPRLELPTFSCTPVPSEENLQVLYVSRDIWRAIADPGDHAIDVYWPAEPPRPPDHLLN